MRIYPPYLATDPTCLLSAMEKCRFKVPEKTCEHACHILPCRVEYRGPAEKNMQVQHTDGVYHTTFRGRPLQGHQVDLKGYRILQLEPQRDADSTWQKSSQLLEKYIIYDHGRDAAQSDPWGDRLGHVLEMANSVL